MDKKKISASRPSSLQKIIRRKSRQKKNTTYTLGLSVRENSLSLLLTIYHNTEPPQISFIPFFLSPLLPIYSYAPFSVKPLIGISD